MVFDPIPLKKFFKEVQKEYPHYNQSTHSKWQQRYNLPRAAVVSASSGKGPIEGHVPKQMVAFVKEILALKNRGYPLKLAFEQIDEHIIGALEQLINKDINSDTYLHFQRKTRTLFTPHLKEIVAILRDFEEKRFKGAGADGDLTEEQVEAHDALLEDVSIEIFRYLTEYNRVHSCDRDLKSNIFMSFDNIWKLKQFCFDWGVSRNNAEIMKLCMKLDNIYRSQPIEDPDEDYDAW